MNLAGDISPHWNLDAAAPIQRTLAIPLVGRARAGAMFPALGFSDPEAERLVAALRLTGLDELGAQKKTVWGSIIRTQVFDEVTRQFLDEHPGATVVNLGAGLCTRRSRVGARAGRWIEADVADVIAAKQRLAPDAGTERVACDLADPEAERLVVDDAVDDGPVLVIAEGVTMFLDPAAMRRLLALLERRLPAGSRIVFDYLAGAVRRLGRLHPAMRTTGASYQSDFRPARELALYPRLRPLGLRLFTDRYPLAMRAVDRLLGLIFAGGSALYDVAHFAVEDRPRRATHGGVAALTVLGFAAATAAGMAVPLLYWPLQVVSALFMLRAFCLVHELSHGNVFHSRRANDAWGLVASLICALPYHPWKKIHVEHHKWAGWREQDPTEGEDWHALKPAEQKIASAAWRLSLPLLGVSFSVRTFWNVPRLFRLFPRDRRALLGSMLAIAAVHGGAAVVFGGAYAAAYLPAFVLFLFLLDPIMISQHVGIPLPDTRGREPRPLPHREQEPLARTLIFPAWVTRHILLGFNHHSLHHERPALPGHLLEDVPFAPTHVESWWTWLKRAKRTPLGTLLTGEPS